MPGSVTRTVYMCTGSAGAPFQYNLCQEKSLIRIVAAAALFLVFAHPAKAQQQVTLSSLVTAADAIVVAQIEGTDYSRTPSDGPMVARAKVLRVVKGRLRRDQSFEFTETAWVGPNYQKGEVRILFMESAGRSTWRVLSNLYAKINFFIAPEAIPDLNMNSLKTALERLSPSGSKNILITGDMLKPGN